MGQEDLLPEQIVRGVVQRVTFHNPENGYCVLQVATTEASNPITIVGNCLQVSSGAHVVARGLYREHTKFGRQLVANSIVTTAPSSGEGLERYLSSGRIKGIGPVTASRIIEKFGDDTERVIMHETKRVAAVRGVGQAKAELLRDWMLNQQSSEKVIQFLSEHGVQGKLAYNIYERFRLQTIEVLKHDPYVLAREVRGIGFQTADQIAKSLGLAPTAAQRLRAGLHYALQKAADDGHTYLPSTMLCERAQLLLGLEEPADLSIALQDLAQEGIVLVDEEQDITALPHLQAAERFIAQFVQDRVGERRQPTLPHEVVEQALSNAEDDLRLTFSTEQRQAVFDAVQQRLLIVTGGPGCGKTTIIRALAHLFSRNGKTLSLAAPTGRAAQRMSQVCSLPASTIHRLLRYDPSSGHFIHGINEPLPSDVVIIDETSMLDVLLAKDLFSAIPADATLLLIGDKDQLPSVGPGRVFADLIGCHAVKTVALSRLFRREESSLINVIAHTLNSGNVPHIPEPDGMTSSDAYFIQRDQASDAALTVEKLIADQIPKKFGFRSDEIAVLTPSNRGPLGTHILNEQLQAALNPAGDPEQELHLNHGIFRLGDRVCQRVNNYQLDGVGVFNGDNGRIEAVDKRMMSLSVELWDGRLIKYQAADLAQLSLAYALTVHRSQGSEYPCVVLALHESHFNLLERQLVYTAVTRAKKLLIVVGSRKALALASRRVGGKRRMTLLNRFLA